MMASGKALRGKGLVGKREYAEGSFYLEPRKNIFKKKKQFPVKVLSTPMAYSGPATIKQDSAVLSTTGIDSKYVFAGRILDPKMAHNKLLNDPCDEATTNDPAYATRLQCLHTQITLSKAGGHPDFEIGDVIICRFSAGDNGSMYNLQNAEFVNVRDKFKNKKSGKDSSKISSACATASQSFAGANFSNLGQTIAAGAHSMGVAVGGSVGTVGGATGNSPGQKGVYIPGNLPITNGTLSGHNLIAGATQGYKTGHPRVLKDVVSEWDSMAAAFAANFSDKGWKLAGSGDRTYATQVSLKASKGNLAATPGTSNHGWGLAVDTHYYDGNGKKKSLSFSGEAYKWLFTNASKYNWENPYWAQKPSVSEELGRPCVAPAGKRCGSKKEVWHWESTRRDSLVKKGTTAYKEAVAAAAPQAPPPEAGDGTTEQPAEETGTG
jgi:hypothetical protein